MAWFCIYVPPDGLDVARKGVVLLMVNAFIAEERRRVNGELEEMGLRASGEEGATRLTGVDGRAAWGGWA